MTLIETLNEMKIERKPGTKKDSLYQVHTSCRMFSRRTRKQGIFRHFRKQGICKLKNRGLNVRTNHITLTINDDLLN